MTIDTDQPGKPQIVPGQVVSRQDNESYTLDVWVQSAEAATETQQFTYGRTDGLYQISPEDNEEVVEELKGVFDELFDEYGAVDENALSLTPGDGVEILVDVHDGVVAPYDSTFGHTKSSLVLSPDHTPELIEKVDEVFDVLRKQAEE